MFSQHHLDNCYKYYLFKHDLIQLVNKLTKIRQNKTLFNLYNMFLFTKFRNNYG